MREAVTGSEVEGFYGLLRGVTSHSHLLPSQPLFKKPCHAPHATTSQPPPWESTGPKVSDPADQAMEPASPAALSALEEAIPAHMQPLCIQVGASNECTDAGLRVQGGPINLMSHYLHPCEKGPLRSRVGVLPLW